MAWLDSLRGVAAMAVVWWHLGPRAIADLQDLHRHVDVGKSGVVLFFLVSGYVIPMSLERHGDLRKFWVSRILRLYPAWAVSVLLVLTLFATGVQAVPEPLSRDPLGVVLGHLSMTQGLLGIPNVVGVYWTLSYEMIFYLIVAGLFGLGLHRRSAWIACLAAGIALVAGPDLPRDLLTGGIDRRYLVAVTVLLCLIAVIAAAVDGRRRLILAASVVGVSMLLIPLLNGGQSTARDTWQTLLLMAVMFAGTVIYRMHHGQMSTIFGGGVLVFVTASWMAGGWWYLTPGQSRRVWITTLLIAAAGFAVGFALRHRAMPPVAMWLGRISYSVYLLHLPLLVVFVKVLPDITERSVLLQAPALAGYLAVVLLSAHLVFRYVEIPAQNLGRRLSRKPESQLRLLRGISG
ncbi:acyltransferase family protein [Actinoplanes sp. GCM10030250]|uniref:acyltransferase family protein n=1 Tax=Actinoplanes sp. GCM10030250 TaxID=3273376 RepID=UPI00362125AC